VDIEKILHGTLLTEINNVVDDRLLLIAPTALKAPLTLKPKLHRFDLSLYLNCCKLGLQYTGNESIKWSLSIIVQICGNNRHFSVCYRNLLSTDARCLVGSAIWSILREAASCGPSALADTCLVSLYVHKI